MKQLFQLLLIAFLPLFMNAQQASRLKVWLDPITEQMMQSAGFEMDHGIVKRGVFIVSDYTAAERSWLDAHGVRYDVEIDDVVEYYTTRMASVERSSRVDCAAGGASNYPTPSDFALGSMGGFFTYEEFLSHLDDMAASYPNLITAKAPIDTFLTHENRPIYWLKISDNPQVNESEPEVLYTAIHHAREPESLSQLIFFMYYILENYGSDDEVTHLVDNTEMYFIPMINPDGYVRNQTTNSNGGGMWRKNRRDNGDGTRGVDLNRNYGYNWGLNDAGSSPTTSSETYRGTAAFSEPETRAVKWLCDQNDFRIAMNYHAFGNYLIYPWGFQEQPLSPDSLEFIAFAEQMTRDNNYFYGTGFQTVGYSTNGDSDDWMYGEQTSKAKILSMTPEVGNQDDGFWPEQSRIIPLAEDNVLPNLMTAHFGGDYLSLQDLSDRFLPNFAGTIDLQVTRLGLEYSGAHSVELIGVSSNVLSTGGALPIGALAHLQSQTVSPAFALDPSIQSGDAVVFDVEVTMNGYSYTERIEKIFGMPTTVYDGFDEFDIPGTWALTDEAFVSPSESLTDSPYSDYTPSQVSVLNYERIIDLRSAVSAQISFQAQWEIEDGWDYCQMQASPIASETWQPLCGLYTETGTSNQDNGEPVWDGIQPTWVLEQIDLSDYIGQRIKVRFRMVSDQFVDLDGYYIDDFEFNALLDQNPSFPLDTGFVDTVGSDTTIGIRIIDESFAVYPNPTNGVLNIKNTSGLATKLTLYSITGQLIDQKQFAPGRASWNLGNVAPGTYILQVKVGEELRIDRLIIEP